MAIATISEKNNLAAKYAADAQYAAVYTTVPTGGTPGTEPVGGSYARVPLQWTDPDTGVVTATATFSIPAGTTIVGAGLHSALTGGAFIDGGSVTSRSFSAQGSYTITLTYTQT
jgi:hypothetical protein